MNLAWHEDARSEFRAAARYYAAIDVDLADRFVAGVDSAIARMRSAPLLYRQFDGPARKVRVERFPYAVVFWIEGTRLCILAVMHLHREPGYWRKRLSDF